MPRAAVGALALTQDVFNGKGVSAIIGAASSGPSMSAALVTGKVFVPQISYSSTSALLSDGQTYSTFLRTPPSDAFQGVGIADLIKNLFGYTRVATVSSTDGYGAAGIAAFHTAADEIGRAGLLRRGSDRPALKPLSGGAGCCGAATLLHCCTHQA